MIGTLVYLVIYVIVIGLVCGLLLYLIDVIPLQQPFHRVARVAIIAIGVLAVIFLLLGLIDGSGVPRLRVG